MNAYEREITRTRRTLLGIEARTALVLHATYEGVTGRVRETLARLAQQIAEARRRNIDVSATWLHRQERYTALLAQLEDGLSAAAGTATTAIAAGQRAAAARAPLDAEDLTLAAMGAPAPRGGEPVVRSTFHALASGALDAFVGRSSDGAPLGLHLLDLAPQTAQRVKDTLAYAIATGQSARDTAQAVTTDLEGTVVQAQTIARTEILTAYRSATDIAYRQSMVVRGWRWYAAINERTCLVCLAMHGTEHPLEEPLASHPACRCTKVPVVLSWAELGFTGVPDHRPVLETGEEAFARLPRADREAIVGPQRLALLEAGGVSLGGMVRSTHSPRWGPGRRAATLSELAP